MRWHTRVLCPWHVQWCGSIAYVRGLLLGCSHCTVNDSLQTVFDNTYCQGVQTARQTLLTLAVCHGVHCPLVLLTVCSLHDES